MNSLIAICGGKPERREAAKTRTGISASLHKRAEGIARIRNLFGPLFWDARNPTHQALALFKSSQQSSSICAYVDHFSNAPFVYENNRRPKETQGVVTA
ncbi:hypothetical protein [Nitratireductor sp. CH_MIT9313-5]|uniref:hypothetical protein n=1 Tax=Nitratireductor sp. CH_MIT9313-5 TaxID=3107764 RepID=UPI003009DE69